MKAYRHLVKYALNEGYTISVWDGEEWQVKHSNKFKEITDAIESVDEAEIRIRTHKNGDLIAWALISTYGLEDEETVIDYSDNEFMQTWCEIYDNR